MPGGNLVQSLDSGFVDAATLNPPTMFFAQRRGFVRLLDIGSLVEMASGGLTAMNRTIKARPDEVKRIIRALQLGKRAMLKSRERTLDLITHVLKMDKETSRILTNLSGEFQRHRIPTLEGTARHQSDQSEGRFAIEYSL